MGPGAATGRVIDSRPSQRSSVTPTPGAAEPGAAGRALVPLAGVERAVEYRAARLRPSATFLAQLIAANQNLPQARERRRAEPHEAIAAYAAAARAA